MPLQDLTPQLRTRLNRVERGVGWFVALATILLLVGFGFYLYNTAQKKGWFVVKAKFFTYVTTGAGLGVGDQVTLMGFPAGAITDITPMPPFPRTKYNVYVGFELEDPNFGYMLTTGSVAQVAASGFLDKRSLEVTKGTDGYAVYLQFRTRDISLADAGKYQDPKWRLAEEIYSRDGTTLVRRAFSPLTNMDQLASLGHDEIRILDRSVRHKHIEAEWNEHTHRYDPYSKTNKPYYLPPDESPSVTEQVQGLVAEVQGALPSFLSLTNQLIAVLSNTASLTSNLNYVAQSVQPVITNLSLATANLDQPGALGSRLLPTNLDQRLDLLLGDADLTLNSANTNITDLMEKIGLSLENLAELTSNLNAQVHANTNMLTDVSQTVVDADDLVQGLKHHWLLRSAFKKKRTTLPEPTNSPSSGK